MATSERDWVRARLVERWVGWWWIDRWWGEEEGKRWATEDAKLVEVASGGGEGGWLVGELRGGLVLSGRRGVGWGGHGRGHGHGHGMIGGGGGSLTTANH